MFSVGIVVCGSVGTHLKTSLVWGREAQMKTVWCSVCPSVVAVGIEVGAPEGVVGDGVKVV
jgi:hypothetical protein